MSPTAERAFEDYLGDGAYVYLDQYGAVVLYTSNGIETTNRVVLEAEVLAAFTRWLDRVQQELTRAQGKGAASGTEGTD